jgi:peptide subunit release factor 1 (eRF1)
MPENRLTSSWDTSLILEMLATNYTIGVVLLRLGRYAVAVYQGRRLVSSRADARYVKGRHHAGGSSQKRFQRIREGQARKIYDKTCQAVHEQFTPYSRQLDYILLGGERFTLLGFLKVCPYLEQFQNIILGRRLNIRDPKHDTLEMEVVERLWESRVYQLQWQ